MSRLTHLLTLISLSILLIGVGCTSADVGVIETPADSAESSQPAATPTAATATAATATATLDPQAVTEAFYSWYLDLIGDRSDGTFTNPLVEQRYRESPYLTGAFITRIDETIAGFDQGGYDPLLQAQDVPVRIEVQPANINGAAATAIVLRYWGGNDDPSPMTVHLRQGDAGWQIDNVTAFEVPVPVEPESADTVVRAFYEWYLGYIGDPGSDNFRNPVVDGAYRDTPYLSDGFVDQLDARLDALREEYGYVPADPFLCAQDIPDEMIPDVTFETGDTAAVVVRSTFPDHLVTVDLRHTDNVWLITDVICPNTPAGAAKTFYTWYLGTIGDRSDGSFTNPLVTGAYRDHPLLSDAFEATIDETLAGFDQGGFDPFLRAQDIPVAFTVDPGVTPDTAVVHLQFGPDSVTHLRLTFEQNGSRQQITVIAEDTGLPSDAPVDDTGDEANTLVDDVHGFSLTIPDGWVVDPITLGGPGQPDDWPVVAGWLIMPPDIAAQLDNAGPPDPSAPAIVAPFHVEVVIGDRAALERVYGSLDGTAMALNGYEATVLSRDPGYQHVVIAHPGQAETWLVATDWVTAFPGREAQAEVAQPQWQPLLKSVRFDG